MNKICIYHGKCNDGFGAAYAVWQKFMFDCEYYAATYGETPPDVTGKDVFIVDFSYKLPVLIEMSKKANSIVILDHHKSAEEDLKNILGVGNITGVFDMNRSGAVIAWEYFHPKRLIPDLIKHIQDRDLWRFELKNTKKISMALSSYEHDFFLWKDLIWQTQRLAEEGESIERYHRKQVEEAKAKAWKECIGDHEVPVVNAPPSLASDVAGELSIGHPFAAVFWVSNEFKTYSLRSREDGEDVSKIAKSFGGGGHKNAAGFSIKIK